MSLTTGADVAAGQSSAVPAGSTAGRRKHRYTEELRDTWCEEHPSATTSTEFMAENCPVQAKAVH
jgi:hypothetical protein